MSVAVHSILKSLIINYQEVNDLTKSEILVAMTIKEQIGDKIGLPEQHFYRISIELRCIQLLEIRKLTGNMYVCVCTCEK